MKQGLTVEELMDHKRILAERIEEALIKYREAVGDYPHNKIEFWTNQYGHINVEIEHRL